jgi:HAD superfamily hydrolase (TIGR01509 family)
LESGQESQPRATRHSPFAAVVFDMDGVLLDSEPLHHQVLNAVLAVEGHQLSFEQYRPYIGTTLEYTWTDLIDRLGLAGPIGAYIARYDEAVLEGYRRHSELAPGARALLEKLTRLGIRRAVASSSQTAWVETCLQTMGVRDFFEVVVTGEMVTRSKPDPEIYRLAASRLGVDPARCLAVEDAPKGVQSAVAAGMTVVGVRTPYTAHLPLDGAATVLVSLEAFPLERLT